MFSKKINKFNNLLKFFEGRKRSPQALLLALGGYLTLSTALFGAAALAQTAPTTSGQQWPSRPGRLIVTAAPGGTLDALARVLAEDFSRNLGHPWVVETRAGVSGNLGAELLVKSAADGYTALVCPAGPFAINAQLLPSMPFDPQRDLAPVSLLAVAPQLLVVHPSVPAKNLRELIDYARAHPGKVSYGSCGNGSVQHIDDIPDNLKALYRTAWEIPQRSIIDMSADRGAFICQSQSLNVFMENVNAAKLTSMHFYSWKKGLKTGMYYLRTKAATDAIKFTVDKKYKSAPVTASVEAPAAVVQAPVVPTTIGTEQAALACSIENGPDCEMCSG